MSQRFVTIWFRHLLTDWFTRRRPELAKQAFVLALPDHGRLVINATNVLADRLGIHKGMPVADARAIFPDIQVLDQPPDVSEKLLSLLARWCIRYTPIVAVDPPDGLILDVSGCAHLWGGEASYIRAISDRLSGLGYFARLGMADTISSAFAVSRYAKAGSSIIPSGLQLQHLLPLPPEALRFDTDIVLRLHRLGIRTIETLVGLPRPSLLRRFGPLMLQRLDEAWGARKEIIHSIAPIITWEERLPCLEPIVTATGISMALERLLTALAFRLKQQEKGLRKAALICYRIDHGLQTLLIETTRPSANPAHLFKLFEPKLTSIEPNLGIELFVLQAPIVEDLTAIPCVLWDSGSGLHDPRIGELLDRIQARIGSQHVHRYLPAERYWPERAVRTANSLDEQATIAWRTDRVRPIYLLPTPKRIEVTAPVPDYPPMNFRYQGTLHKVIRADGPERIEREWWVDPGPHRDYYCVEDEAGRRYWLFRSGHYEDAIIRQWFLHGFFA